MSVEGRLFSLEREFARRDPSQREVDRSIGQKLSVEDMEIAAGIVGTIERYGKSRTDLSVLSAWQLEDFDRINRKLEGRD